MNILRTVRRSVVVAFVLVGIMSAATPADAGPFWTGCRPDVDPETLEISTLCY